MRGGQDEHKDILAMVDTEQKQLQAIEDLSRIVFAQPRYKKLKSPSWKPEDSPILVLQWLLRKLGPLAKGNQWTIDTWKQGKVLRYRFVVYKYFNGYDLKARSEFLPLDFMPYLKKRDEALHNMILDLIALVSKRNSIPLWHEDGDYSAVMKEFIKEKVTGNSVLDRQVESYKKGPAFEYLNLLKARRETVRAADITRQMSKYDACSQRKREFMFWIKHGLVIAETGLDLKPWTYVPNYFTGPAISPLRLYKFVWSVNAHDYVSCSVVENLFGDDYEEFPPVKFTATKPGQVVCPIKESDFPPKFYQWISYGIKLILWRYRDYFYKKQMAEFQTPAEELLERIEETEITINV